MATKQTGQPGKSNMPVWKQNLSIAYSKFLTYSDIKKAKEELAFAAQLFKRNPELQKCELSSVIDAVVNIARTGTTINPILQLAHLIPRGGKCILEMDYKGLVKLLKDYDCLKQIDAFIVYKDEKYEYDIGTGKVEHEIKYADTEPEQRKRKMKGAYTRAVLTDGTVVFSPLMNAWEIDKAQKRGKSQAWQYWYEEMVKKTVLRRSFKTLLTGEIPRQVQEAMRVDDENTIGEKQKEPTFSDIYGGDDIEDADIVEEAGQNEERKTPEGKKNKKTTKRQ